MVELTQDEISDQIGDILIGYSRERHPETLAQHCDMVADAVMDWIDQIDPRN